MAGCHIYRPNTAFWLAVIGENIHCSGRHDCMGSLLSPGRPSATLSGRTGSGQGAFALSTALELLQRLGIPVALHKIEGPSTTLGISIDTTRFELRLPYGCGSFIQSLGWFQVKWPAFWEPVNIAAKKLVPIVIAAAL